jgi:hypothetical protein
MHKADAQALRLMSVIGGKADIDRHGRWMARSLMTQKRHSANNASITSSASEQFGALMQRSNASAATLVKYRPSGTS